MFRLLHQAQEQAYKKDEIMSAFKATGIKPFDPYSTPVMKEYQAKMASQKATTHPRSPSHPVPPLTPQSRCITVTTSSRDIFEDPEASIESLRHALGGMLGVMP